MPLVLNFERPLSSFFDADEPLVHPNGVCPRQALLSHLVPVEVIEAHTRACFVAQKHASSFVSRQIRDFAHLREEEGVLA